ncbi:hypothetical protein Peur_061135 [Populus x canadensis]
MTGADVRIRRDPLAKRMREDQIKQMVLAVLYNGQPVKAFWLTVSSLNEVDGEEDGIKCNWSVYKTTPQARKSKAMRVGSDQLASLDEANDDSENLTDFLVGFEQEE